MPKDNFAQNSNNSSENATFALGLYSDISDDELISKKLRVKCSTVNQTMVGLRHLYQMTSY